jgi:hypothetical protein
LTGVVSIFLQLISLFFSIKFITELLCLKFLFVLDLSFFLLNYLTFLFLIL